MDIRGRLACSGWEVYPRFALNTAEGAVDAGEDKFRIDVIGEAGLPRRGAVHLVGFLPRLHMRIDGAVSRGGGQQLRIAWLWEDVTSGAGDKGGRTRWKMAIMRQTGERGGERAMCLLRTGPG